MRSVVTVFAVAILARIAVRPVWTLIEQADDDTPPGESSSAARKAASRP
jgi:hypothetical protein